jgi:serine/threonine protein kinase
MGTRKANRRDDPLPLAPDELVDFLARGGRGRPPSSAEACRRDTSADEDEAPTDADLDLSAAGPLALNELGRLDDPNQWSEDDPIPTAPEDVLDAPATPARRTSPKPAARPATPPTSGPRADEMAKLVGNTLGNYDVGPVLGTGHSGTVFRARDARDGRTVALKVLRPLFPKNDEELQRFMQTLKAVQPLRHPHLVTVLDLGRTGAYVWLALDYVEGESVRQRIQRADDADWQPAFRVAVHAGRALHCLGRHQLVHRNFTPQNLLWRATDQSVKLADTGLAKALVGSALRQVSMRAALQRDLPYLSPEHTEPKAKLDGRSDLYGLGAVVYDLLAGRPPFAGKSSAETVGLIRQGEPVRPRVLQPAIPEAFEGIVMKLLAKHPEDRFQKAADLLKALAAISPDPC